MGNRKSRPKTETPSPVEPFEDLSELVNKDADFEGPSFDEEASRTLQILAFRKEQMVAVRRGVDKRKGWNVVLRTPGLIAGAVTFTLVATSVVTAGTATLVIFAVTGAAGAVASVVWALDALHERSAVGPLKLNEDERDLLERDGGRLYELFRRSRARVEADLRPFRGHIPKPMTTPEGLLKRMLLKAAEATGFRSDDVHVKKTKAVVNTFTYPPVVLKGLRWLLWALRKFATHFDDAFALTAKVERLMGTSLGAIGYAGGAVATGFDVRILWKKFKDGHRTSESRRVEDLIAKMEDQVAELRRLEEERDWHLRQHALGLQTH